MHERIILLHDETCLPVRCNSNRDRTFEHLSNIWLVVSQLYFHGRDSDLHFDILHPTPSQCPPRSPDNGYLKYRCFTLERDRALSGISGRHFRNNYHSQYIHTATQRDSTITLQLLMSLSGVWPPRLSTGCSLCLRPYRPYLMPSFPI